MSKQTAVTVGLWTAGLALIGWSMGWGPEPVRSSIMSVLGDSSATPRAASAIPFLRTALTREQLNEMRQGEIALLTGRFDDARPVIVKYAMMGVAQNQNALAIMYYFGKGMPRDPEEGVQWLRLSAAQGNRFGQEALAAVRNGTWHWDAAIDGPSTDVVQTNSSLEGSWVPEQAAGGSNGIGAAARGAIISPAQPPSVQPGQIATTPNNGMLGARGSQDPRWESSARNTYSQARTSGIGMGEPVILNRAGPGTYSGGGDIYTQAGPHGVVNTRTGEFSPTN